MRNVKTFDEIKSSIAASLWIGGKEMSVAKQGPGTVESKVDKELKRREKIDAERQRHTERLRGLEGAIETLSGDEPIHIGVTNNSRHAELHGDLYLKVYDGQDMEPIRQIILAHLKAVYSAIADELLNERDV